MLDLVAIPANAGSALFHVRDYTKGHPSLAANNHPIRHGAIVGVHNGIIANDDALFERHGFERAEPGMTVDSEAIFALVEISDDVPVSLEELYGSMATAWLDERAPETVFAARGLGRPLWLGKGRSEVVFASTVAALELVERYTGVGLDKREIDEGTLLTLREGAVAESRAFTLDRSFTEEPLPAVRAPDEGRSCLERLAALASGTSVAPAQA